MKIPFKKYYCIFKEIRRKECEEIGEECKKYIKDEQDKCIKHIKDGNKCKKEINIEEHILVYIDFYYVAINYKDKVRVESVLSPLSLKDVINQLLKNLKDPSSNQPDKNTPLSIFINSNHFLIKNVDKEQKKGKKTFFQKIKDFWNTTWESYSENARIERNKKRDRVVEKYLPCDNLMYKRLEDTNSFIIVDRRFLSNILIVFSEFEYRICGIYDATLLNLLSIQQKSKHLLYLNISKNFTTAIYANDKIQKRVDNKGLFEFDKNIIKASDDLNSIDDINHIYSFLERNTLHLNNIEKLKIEAEINHNEIAQVILNYLKSIESFLSLTLTLFDKDIDSVFIEGEIEKYPILIKLLKELLIKKFIKRDCFYKVKENEKCYISIYSINCAKKYFKYKDKPIFRMPQFRNILPYLFLNYIFDKRYPYLKFDKNINTIFRKKKIDEHYISSSIVEYILFTQSKRSKVYFYKIGDKEKCYIYSNNCDRKHFFISKLERSEFYKIKDDEKYNISIYSINCAKRYFSKKYLFCIYSKKYFSMSKKRSKFYKIKDDEKCNISICSINYAKKYFFISKLERSKFYKIKDNEKCYISVYSINHTEKYFFKKYLFCIFLKRYFKCTILQKTKKLKDILNIKDKKLFRDTIYSSPYSISFKDTNCIYPYHIFYTIKENKNLLPKVYINPIGLSIQKGKIQFVYTDNRKFVDKAKLTVDEKNRIEQINKISVSQDFIEEDEKFTKGDSEAIRKKGKNKMSKKSKSSGILEILLFFMIIAVVIYFIYGPIEKKYKNFRNALDKIYEIQEKKKVSSISINRQNSMDSNRSFWTNEILTISNSVPKSIWLISIKTADYGNQNTLKVNGNLIDTENYLNDISIYMHTLEKRGMKVNFKGAKIVPSYYLKNRLVANFTLEIIPKRGY